MLISEGPLKFAVSRPVAKQVENMSLSTKEKVDEDLDVLKAAIQADNKEVALFLFNNYKKFIPVSTSVHRLIKRVDYLSACLLPKDIHPNLVPYMSTGDGNCLYNSASLLLSGDEDLSGPLRLVTAAEMFLHQHFYANHPRYVCSFFNVVLIITN